MSRRNSFFIPLNSSEFDILTLPNLAFWCKSDTGITLDGGYVTQWNDLSGYDNHLIQNSLSYKPLFVTNQINSYPSVQFDGVDDSMQTPSFSLGQPTTIFIIYKTPILKDSAYILDGYNGDSAAYFQYYGVIPTALLYMYGGVSFYPIQGLDGSYFLATLIFNSSSSIHQVNNNIEDTGNAGGGSMNGLTLGAYGAGGYNGNPHIAEVIIMSSVANTTDRNDVKGYVTSRYGISM